MHICCEMKFSQCFQNIRVNEIIGGGLLWSNVWSKEKSERCNSPFSPTQKTTKFVLVESKLGLQPSIRKESPLFVSMKANPEFERDPLVASKGGPRFEFRVEGEICGKRLLANPMRGYHVIVDNRLLMCTSIGHVSLSPFH